MKTAAEWAEDIDACGETETIVEEIRAELIAELRGMARKRREQSQHYAATGNDGLANAAWEEASDWLEAADRLETMAKERG